MSCTSGQVHFYDIVTSRSEYYFIWDSNELRFLLTIHVFIDLYFCFPKRSQMRLALPSRLDNTYIIDIISYWMSNNKVLNLLGQSGYN